MQSEYISYFKYLLCAASDGPALNDVFTCVNMIALLYMMFKKHHRYTSGNNHDVLLVSNHRSCIKTSTIEIYYDESIAF